jgi:hypothetical protein
VELTRLAQLRVQGVLEQHRLVYGQLKLQLGEQEVLALLAAEFVVAGALEVCMEMAAQGAVAMVTIAAEAGLAVTEELTLAQALQVEVVFLTERVTLLLGGLQAEVGAQVLVIVRLVEADMVFLRLGLE